MLIIELDGPEIEVNTLLDRVAKIMNGAGASSLKISNSEEERDLFWAGRKSAFPAVGAFRLIIFMDGLPVAGCRYDGPHGVAEPEIWFACCECISRGRWQSPSTHLV